MNTNPLLEEIWAIKDKLVAEADGDLHIFCRQLRTWSEKNLPKGLVIHDPADIRSLQAEQSPAESLVLGEEPPNYPTKPH